MKKEKQIISIEKSREIITVSSNILTLNSKKMKTSKLYVKSFYKMTFETQNEYEKLQS